MNTRKDLASPLGTPSMARPRYTSEIYTVAVLLSGFTRSCNTGGFFRGLKGVGSA